MGKFLIRPPQPHTAINQAATINTIHASSERPQHRPMNSRAYRAAMREAIGRQSANAQRAVVARGDFPQTPRESFLLREIQILRGENRRLRHQQRELQQSLRQLERYIAILPQAREVSDQASRHSEASDSPTNVRARPGFGGWVSDEESDRETEATPPVMTVNVIQASSQKAAQEEFRGQGPRGDLGRGRQASSAAERQAVQPA